MSENPAREKITDQDILKVFDSHDDPFLTSGEIAEQLPVSRQAVNYRLDRMHSEGLVGRKKTGARSVGWWAEVAPRLSAEARQRADTADREKAISQDAMKRRLGMNG
jgi:repressor of nif and glnA expression